MYLYSSVQAWATGNALDTVREKDFGGFENSSQQRISWLWDLETWHFKQQLGNCKILTKSAQDPRHDLMFTHKYWKIPFSGF